MSQITRCPHCATAFKVVADQLRISDGWVRCGQCKEVFDASEHLLMDESEPLLPEMPLHGLHAPQQSGALTPDSVHVWGSARGTEPSATPEGPPADLAPPQAAEGQELDQPSVMTGAVPEGADTPRYAEVRAHAGTPAHADDTHEPIVLSSLLRQESSAQALMAPAAPLQEIQGYELPGAQQSDSGWPEDTVAEAPVAPEAGAEGAPTPLPQEPTAAASENSDEQPAQAEQPDLQMLEPAQSEPLLAEEAALMPTVALADSDPAHAETAALPEEPGFVATARRKAFWRRPVVRAALVMLGLVFLLALSLQMTLQERELIAARNPAMRTLLEQLCQPLGCTLDAPQRIEAVVIDSSSFLKARHDDASYELQMAIKNNATFAVAMPALELTLTDAQDQTLLRRVLLRDELGAPAQLAPGATWSASVPMQVMQGAAQVAGYRLLAFYP